MKTISALLLMIALLPLAALPAFAVETIGGPNGDKDGTGKSPPQSVTEPIPGGGGGSQYGSPPSGSEAHANDADASKPPVALIPGQPTGGTTRGNGTKDTADKGGNDARTTTETDKKQGSTFEDRPGETVALKVSRLSDHGSETFHTGVVMVANGITQVSLAGQDKEEGGANDENKELEKVGLKNIADGTVKIEAGRATVDHANKIAEHENRRASIGASGALPLRTLSADKGKLPSGGQEKLDEMEKVAGVTQASLFDAANHGSREEIVSLAGGAKSVGLSSAEIMAGIPTFSFAVSASTGMPSMPTASENYVVPAGGGLANSGPFAVSQGRKAGGERNLASSGALAGQQNVAEEKLTSLGADNLLSSLGGSSVKGSTEQEPEGTLFQRVSKQYKLRFAELLQKNRSAR